MKFIISYFNNKFGGDIPPDLYPGGDTIEEAREALDRVQRANGTDEEDIYGIHEVKDGRIETVEQEMVDHDTNPGS